MRGSSTGAWSTTAAVVIAATILLHLLSPTNVIASTTAETQLVQQEVALSSQFTWAQLVDEHEHTSMYHAEAAPHVIRDEENFDFAAIETSQELEANNEGEADMEANTQVDSEVESDIDAAASAEAETESDESLPQQVQETFPVMIEEDESMSILLELSDHMDVSSILEHKHHQQMFQFKPKKASAGDSGVSASKAARGSAASRLTKDVQASKFARFTSKQKRKYSTPKEAANAFQIFSKNREEIVALNDEVAPNRPAVFKSTGPFADKATGEFKKIRTNSKIQLGRAKGKAVRIKRRKGVKERNAKKDSSLTIGSGRSAGFSGQSAGQSGKTGGKSGKTAGDAGGKAKKSGKTGGDAGGKAKKSGKTGGDSGGKAKKSGKTGGESGSTGKKSGKTGGESGVTGKKSGKTGGESGKDGKKSGKTGGTKGDKKKKDKKNDIVLQPNDIALPPSSKTKKEKESKLPTDIGVTVDSIRASMKAAGVTDAEISAAFSQMKGEYKKGGDIGMDLFGYQKGSCGSCWAHAAGDALTRLWKKQQKWISNELISVQQVLDCVKTPVSNGCNGGSPMDAIEYWTNNAIALMNEYPLKSTTGTCKPSPFGGRPNYKAAFGWEMSVPPCEEKGGCKGQVAYEHLLLKWLKNNSLTPIVYLDASLWQHYSGGIFPLSACSSTTAKGNHIVQIVGYGTDSATGVPYWVIRNSWSRSWGEDGQIRIPFGVNACGVMNFVLSVSDPDNDLFNSWDPVLTPSNSQTLTNQQYDTQTKQFKSSADVEKQMTKSEILARLSVKAHETDASVQYNDQSTEIMKSRAQDFGKEKKALSRKLNENLSEAMRRRNAHLVKQRKAEQKLTAVETKLREGRELLTPEEQKLAKQLQKNQASGLREQRAQYWQSIANMWIQDTSSARTGANLPQWSLQDEADRTQLIIDQMRKIDQRVSSQLRSEDHNSNKYRNTLMNAFITDPVILRIRNDDVPGRNVLTAKNDPSQLRYQTNLEPVNSEFPLKANSQYGGVPNPVDLQNWKTSSTTTSKITFTNSLPSGSSAVRSGPAFPTPTANGQTPSK